MEFCICGVLIILVDVVVSMLALAVVFVSSGLSEVSGALDQFSVIVETLVIVVIGTEIVVGISDQACAEVDKVAVLGCEKLVCIEAYVSVADEILVLVAVVDQVSVVGETAEVF